MSKRRVRVAVFALAVGSMTALSWAQALLTGSVPAGTYTYSNQNLVIRDVTVVPGAVDRTLRVVVTNGTIVVGDLCNGMGINAQGADGADGIDGHFINTGCDIDVVFATGGLKGDPGYSVNLSTVAGPFGTSTLDISVIKPILAHGGRGGRGGHGNAENIVCNHFCPPPGDLCQTFFAGAGKNGAPGGAGGNVTITAAGALSISDGVSVSGGDGGHGGNGGTGGYYSAGAAGGGALGGSAGSIQLSQASTNAACTLGAGYAECRGCFNGGLFANAGHGGNGGSGGDGPGGISGTTGGSAGKAGKIEVSSYVFGMGVGPNICGPTGTSVTALGGNGGHGGNGGQGGQYHVIDPGDVYCGDGYCISPGCTAPSGGGNGGSAGKSSVGGTITISATKQFGQQQLCGISANGGNGANGGSGGGGLASSCPIGCGTCPTVTSGGFAGGSTPGSKAGKVTLSSGSLLGISGSVTSDGGIGGGGGNGGLPGIGCCLPPAGPDGYCPPCPTVAVVAGARVGSAGSAGGTGTSVAITCGTFTMGFTASITACGGSGGNGGNGSQGAPGASGGAAGLVAAAGTVTVNSVPLPFVCSGMNGSAGANGFNLDVNNLCFCP